MFRSTITCLLTAALCSVGVTAQDAPKKGPADAKAQNQDATREDSGLRRPAPIPEPVHLAMAAGDGKLTAVVHGHRQTFLGAVLISASSDTRYYLVSLPPILSDFQVMGIGTTGNGTLELKVPSPLPIKGLTVFGQALTMDAGGLSASDVVKVGKAVDA